jgi:pimeloyl-ACP methyl ester carboxylesterase
VLEVIAKGRTSKSHPYPMLFVHGGWHGAWCWDDHFLDFFAEQGFFAVALSLRGHGTSPARKSLRRCSISDYVEDVTSVANALAPRPIVVGHSMGGFLVQKYLERNDAPAAVLLASAPPHGHMRTMMRSFRQHPWRSTKFSFTGRPADLYGGTTAGARDLFFGEKASDQLIDSITGRLRPESTRALLIDMGVPALARKNRTTTPIYVLGAEQDSFYPYRDLRATATFYGTPPKVIPGIGHAMMLEPRWPMVAECILSWLAFLEL